MGGLTKLGCSKSILTPLPFALFGYVSNQGTLKLGSFLVISQNSENEQHTHKEQSF